MGKIKLLEDSLINKIAAGEVIERPASVVKELIENSLDAGAKKITVSLEGYGLGLISVRDDGCGMEPQDAKSALLRHATSKISSEKDIFCISSLGFRGEALASIASVSRLILRTKESSRNEEPGIELSTEAGKIIGIKEVAMPHGTTIIVNDLFYNTPARKKHLRSDQTELRLITEIVSRYALVFPKVYFELSNDANVLLSTPPSDLIGNICSIYGTEAASSMLEVDEKIGKIHVRGYVSGLGFQRKDKSMISIYINRRYVKNSMINDAVIRAYKTFLNIGYFPAGILDISLDYSDVDVNVHPQKSEVRFSDEELVYDAVFSAIHGRLSSQQNATLQKIQLKKPEKDLVLENFRVTGSRQQELSAAPAVADTDETQDQNLRISEPIQQYAQAKQAHGKEDRLSARTKTEEGKNASITDMTEHNAGSAKIAKDARFKLIGQVLRTYIIVEDEDGLLLIDQHAAEERVNYEKLMAQFAAGDVEVQELISPLTIDLSAMDKMLASEHEGVLKKLGFLLEDFGKNTMLLRAVPQIFGKPLGEPALREVIDELRNTDIRPRAASQKTSSIDDRKEEKIIRRACKASIRANDHLEAGQAIRLIERLLMTNQPRTCPHGRPTMIRFSAYDLEKMFKRVI